MYSIVSQGKKYCTLLYHKVRNTMYSIVSQGKKYYVLYYITR